MLGALQLGRIVWAEIADANGIPKLRPVVIVTPSDRITSAAPLDVIAVTSRVPEPLPNDHVLLPWHAQGHPRTGLNRKCAAICTWVARIRHTDIRDVAGVVPGAVMLGGESPLSRCAWSRRTREAPGRHREVGSAGTV